MVDVLTEDSDISSLIMMDNFRNEAVVGILNKYGYFKIKDLLDTPLEELAEKTKLHSVDIHAIAMCLIKNDFKIKHCDFTEKEYEAVRDDILKLVKSLAMQTQQFSGRAFAIEDLVNTYINHKIYKRVVARKYSVFFIRGIVTRMLEDGYFYEIKMTDELVSDYSYEFLKSYEYRKKFVFSITYEFSTHGKLYRFRDEYLNEEDDKIYESEEYYLSQPYLENKDELEKIKNMDFIEKLSTKIVFDSLSDSLKISLMQGRFLYYYDLVNTALYYFKSHLSTIQFKELVSHLRSLDLEVGVKASEEDRKKVYDLVLSRDENEIKIVNFFTDLFEIHLYCLDYNKNIYTGYHNHNFIFLNYHNLDLSLQPYVKHLDKCNIIFENKIKKDIELLRGLNRIKKLKVYA